MLSSIFSGSAGSFIMELLYRMPAILVALAFHEWAHAYAAYRLGDPTAYNLGRMTLNPLAHIDPWGFVMLALFRFGWAKPVPINPRNFKNYRRDEIIVGLAGVVTNLLLAFVAGSQKVGIWAEILVIFLLAVLPTLQNGMTTLQNVLTGQFSGSLKVAATAVVNSLCSVPLGVSHLAVVLALVACGMSIAYKKMK